MQERAQTGPEDVQALHDAAAEVDRRGLGNVGRRAGECAEPEPEDRGLRECRASGRGLTALGYHSARDGLERSATAGEGILRQRRHHRRRREDHS